MASVRQGKGRLYSWGEGEGEGLHRAEKAFPGRLGDAAQE